MSVERGGLAPAGSSTYSSDTLYVGDGTWNSERNTFLLPNLMGLNFETMRYNGMGNRFRNLNGYHSIVKGHGIAAAITFLFVIPTAIFMARFYHRNPRMALRMHIWLQIVTVGLVTATFILGFVAVGPSRALTNPHHGIGLAIYVLVLVQAIGGGLIHHVEKKKERFKIPLKLMLHQWMGRAIALLGIVQIPLGLTLYGSPKVLFIVYAIWTAMLLLAWFILSYRNQPIMDETGSYISTSRTGSRRSRHKSHKGLKGLAAVGAAGAGLAALRRRSRSRNRRDDEVISSRHSSHRPSDSYIAEEKYTEDGHKPHTWRNRLLGAAAVGGALAAARGLFGGKKRRDSYSESSPYNHHPLGGAHSYVSQTDLSRIEEGRPPSSPESGRHHRPGLGHAAALGAGAAGAAALTGSPSRPPPRRSGASIDSYDSRSSFSAEPHPRPSHNARNTIAALGIAGFLRSKLMGRRDRKEQRRIEEIRKHDMTQERIARANSRRRRYTGDGSPRRHHRPQSYTNSAITGSNPELSRHTLRPPPGNGVGASTTTGDPPILPPPPLVDPVGMAHDSSGSEAYTSAGGRKHHRHRAGRDAALAGTGAAVTAGPSNGRDTSRQRSSDGSVASPPVSVKVKMHNDGRHVTLRRLNEQEAAAAREARRQERQRRGRAGSLSSDTNTADDRWRRAEGWNPAQGRATPSTDIPGPSLGPPPPPTHNAQDELHLPPPPPIPASNTVMSGSPGPSTGPYGTETDISNYDSNRRRRRAERAQAKARAAAGGSRVEFT
ncbi:hypothetical protein M501DRAFT_986091 [Patellaria atrata CBS 101060]|uniref:Cytochrome b561 domain-containing protein n=1 Tax=Patellaria atrata CBS 101060 TaxID=1346257 RepID=A0A9P4S8C7_9PEZI|nr:hypothetical protein M501DRAFT_986091 [Patellaria atrata CBS 101060]